MLHRCGSQIDVITSSNAGSAKVLPFLSPPLGREGSRCGLVVLDNYSVHTKILAVLFETHKGNLVPRTLGARPFAPRTGVRHCVFNPLLNHRYFRTRFSDGPRSLERWERLADNPPFYHFLFCRTALFVHSYSRPSISGDFFEPRTIPLRWRSRPQRNDYSPYSLTTIQITARRLANSSRSSPATNSFSSA